MHARSVPALGPRYWTGIALASVFGTNMGDFVSHVLHLGHVRGLPVLALAFAAAIVAERRCAGNEAFYWVGVALVRTAATNFADLATHDLKLSYPLVIAILGASLVVLAALGHSFRSRPALGGNVAARPATNGRYWLMMLVAGTLGTGLGDYVDDDLGVGTGPGSVLLSAMLALALRARGRLPMQAGYWCVIVAARTAGTAVGDFLAGKDGLGLGLPLSTTMTCLMFAGVLALWQPRHHVQPIEA